MRIKMENELSLVKTALRSSLVCRAECEVAESADIHGGMSFSPDALRNHRHRLGGTRRLGRIVDSGICALQLHNASFELIDTRQ